VNVISRWIPAAFFNHNTPSRLNAGAQQNGEWKYDQGGARCSLEMCGFRFSSGRVRGA